MSSQIPTSLPTSPRKKSSKKGKRRSSNGDDTSRSTKVQRTKGAHALASVAAEHHDESQSAITVQETRRSGRAGAGTGGRTQQLEKVGALLEDRPVRSRQPTDLPEDTAANPLAPPAKSVKAGRRGGGKGPPPPYAPSASSQVPTGPVITLPRPVFHQRSSESDRFGFNAPTPASPPVRTDPSLQIPNNSNSLPSHKAPSSFRTLESHSIDSTLLGGSLPSRKAPGPSHSLERQSIDPALLGNSLPSLETRRCETRIAERMELNEDSSSSSSDESTSEPGASDGVETEHEEGWGATNSRQIAHPGFSNELEPHDPVRHVSLPPDHEFQFSRDEDDASAQRNLDEVQVADDRESERRDPDDVLRRHHQVNGRPSAPDPQALASIASQPAGMEAALRTRAPRNSKKAKDAGLSPKNLGYYPPVWQDCLEDAKRECRVTHLLSNNPFPSKSRDLKSSITLALTTTVAEWNDNGMVFEPDYWPSHKTDMTCVLLGDISTWRSDLKTTAFAVCPVAYNLIPPQDIPPQEKVRWVQDSAARLLADSLFLRDGFDEQGKTNNFAHPALKEIAIRFFYMGSYRIADKRQDDFRHTIPLACIALAGAAINCVLDGFAKNGTATLKTIPQFSGKGYRTTFLTMCKMLNEILRHSYHGRKLRKQLGKWGEEGWASLHQVDADVERDSHLQFVLD